MKHPALMQDRKRVSVWLVVIAVGLISGFSGWVAAGKLRSPQRQATQIVTTIEDVRSHPDAFAGKEVRLAGQLDECYFWECSLCPEAMSNRDRDADHCLALEFRPLVNGTGFGSAEQENVHRFSSVIITARFDPSCLKGLCLDRQTVLEDVKVDSVTRRRAGASGLWLGNTTKLVPIDGPEADRIGAAARRAGYPSNPPIKVFTTVEAEPKVVVCWSSPGFGQHDLGAWPSTLENALYAQSTLDFFHCNEVRKIDGQVVLQVRA